MVKICGNSPTAGDVSIRVKVHWMRNKKSYKSTTKNHKQHTHTIFEKMY